MDKILGSDERKEDEEDNEEENNEERCVEVGLAVAKAEETTSRWT